MDNNSRYPEVVMCDNVNTHAGVVGDGGGDGGGWLVVLGHGLGGGL